MEYQGNSSLSEDVQQRIQSTFQQSLDSARKGVFQEALLGCDFILRLDPEFGPAKQLAAKVREVMARQQGGAASPAPPPPEPQTPNLLPTLNNLMERRNYEQVLEVAHQHHAVVSTDPALGQIVETASERLQAQSYVEGFLRAARQSIESGHLGSAADHLEKARSLDPSHPSLAEVQNELEQSSAASVNLNDPLGADAFAGPELGDAELGDAELGDSELGDSELGDWELPGTSPSAADDPLAAIADPVSAFSEESDPLGATVDDPLAGLDNDPLAAITADPAVEPSAPMPPMPPIAPPTATALDPDAEFDADFGDLDLGGGVPPSVPAAGSDLGSADLGSADFGGGDDNPFEDGGTDRRVQELLDDGQAAFDRGDYQGAIDAWSRIFLIDVDHPKASQLIERARQLKDEGERKIEEVFHEAVAAMDAGDTVAAREGFETILSMQPEHVGAQEYLEELKAGAGGPSLPGSDAPAVPPPPPSDAGLSLNEGLENSVGSFDEDGTLGGIPGDLADEIMMPPEPGSAGASSAAQAAPPAAAGKGKALRSFLLIGGLVLLLVLAAGAYVFMNFDDLFRNADTPVAERPESRTNPIDAARKVYEGGRTDVAIGRLERIPENSRFYEDAQKLLAEWEGLESVTEEPNELDAAEQQRFEELLATADRWVEQDEYLRAREPLMEASQLAPLPSSYDEKLEIGRERADALGNELLLFQDGDWEAVLPDLWRLYVGEATNGDIERLIVDSYYNMGVRSLQRGDLSSAQENFAEVLDLREEDLETQRHFLFADEYQNRDRDLLFRIYVKYLPFR